MKKVVIIGAGIGGLAAAARLAKMGYSVSVFEKNAEPGGKVNVIEEKGYTFDTGAHLLTIPEVFEELFNFCGADINAYVKIKKLDITSRNFFPDRSIINIYSDKAKLLEEIKNKTLENPKNFENYLNRVSRLGELLLGFLLNTSPREFRDMLSFRAMKSGFIIFFVNPFKSLYESLNNQLKDKKLIQIISRFATYTGSNPLKASAALNTIAHTEINLGGHYVEGGMKNLPKGLYKLCVDLGVKFMFNAEVEKVITEKSRIKFGISVRGIIVNGMEIKCDVLVCNADVGYSMQNLLDTEIDIKKEDYNSKKLSNSVLVFLLGIKDTFKQLDNNNMFFAKDPVQEFKDVYENFVAPKDPSFFVSISSKVAPENAPVGKENWFVLIEVPNKKHYQIKESDIVYYRNLIEERLEEYAGVDIKGKVEFEKVLTPEFYENNSSSYNGALYGINGDRLLDLMFRPSNRSRRVKGLYFVGGSVHPGGGLPMVAASAKITSNLIKRHER